MSTKYNDHLADSSWSLEDLITERDSMWKWTSQTSDAGLYRYIGFLNKLIENKTRQ